MTTEAEVQQAWGDVGGAFRVYGARLIDMLDRVDTVLAAAERQNATVMATIRPACAAQVRSEGFQEGGTVSESPEPLDVLLASTGDRP